MPESGFARGNVVFFFCDMANSTAIARTLGIDRFPEEVLEPYHSRLKQALESNQGRILDYTGDGVLAVFQVPQQAIAAAKQLQKDLRDEPIPVMIDKNESFCRTRVGLHRSVVDLQPDEAGRYPTGYDEIAYAHRVMEPGNDGQILVSESLWVAIEGSKQAGLWRAWHNRYLKSYTEAPQSLYSLLWNGEDEREPGSRWLPNWYVREMNLFVGRTKWMKQIEDWLSTDSRRLLTLHGTGGIGKTRLAVETVIQMGGKFPAGIAFVSLDRDIVKRDPETVTVNDLKSAVMQELEVPEEIRSEELYPSQSQTPNFANSPFLIWLKRRLQNKKKLLLVLDNWESVQNDATLDWLRRLFSDSALAGLHCLVTSRMSLGLTNVGQMFEIDFLEMPKTELEIEETESGKLFIERARQLAYGWELSQALRPCLFSILKTLEGHALGIELVAARVKDYPGLVEIESDLGKSLVKVQATRKGQRRNDAERHDSLQASLNWSVERLPSECRVAFARVGAFPADFSSQLAEEVADIDGDSLLTYRDASLLGLFSEGPNRYETRPVIREYCRDLLGNNLESYEQRFVAFCMKLARTFEDQNPDSSRRFSAEHRNFLAMTDTLLRMSDSPEKAGELIWFGIALWKLPSGDRDANLRRAIECYESALRVTTEAAFPQDWAGVQICFGNAYDDLNEKSRALEHFQNAVRGYIAAGIPAEWEWRAYAERRVRELSGLSEP